MSSVEAILLRCLLINLQLTCRSTWIPRFFSFLLWTSVLISVMLLVLFWMWCSSSVQCWGVRSKRLLRMVSKFLLSLRLFLILLDSSFSVICALMLLWKFLSLDEAIFILLKFGSCSLFKHLLMKLMSSSCLARLMCVCMYFCVFACI